MQRRWLFRSIGGSFINPAAWAAGGIDTGPSVRTAVSTAADAAFESVAASSCAVPGKCAVHRAVRCNWHGALARAGGKVAPGRNASMFLVVVDFRLLVSRRRRRGKVVKVLATGIGSDETKLRWTQLQQATSADAEAVVISHLHRRFM